MTTGDHNGALKALTKETDHDYFYFNRLRTTLKRNGKYATIMNYKHQFFPDRPFSYDAYNKPPKRRSNLNQFQQQQPRLLPPIQEASSSSSASTKQQQSQQQQSSTSRSTSPSRIPSFSSLLSRKNQTPLQPAPPATSAVPAKPLYDPIKARQFCATISQIQAIAERTEVIHNKVQRYGSLAGYKKGPGSVARSENGASVFSGITSSTTMTNTTTALKKTGARSVGSAR